MPDASADRAESEAQSVVLRRHLARISDACERAYDGLRAVVLYGSYGRGEGSWYQDTEGRWRPYNDYDLRVITDRKVPTEKVRKLSTALAAQIGIRWVDIGQAHPVELCRLRPSILNYDLKNASKVIFGDESVLDLIPEIDASALPMSEALTLYSTRLYTLSGCLGPNGLESDLSGENSRFFRNQMAKAVLATVDVLLLAKGAYTASYRERVERLAGLYPAKSDVARLSRWALQEKLRPRAPTMTALEARETYGSVSESYLRAMYGALSIHFGRRVRGPADVEFCLKWLPRSSLRRLYGLVRCRGLKMERQIAVQLAMGHVAAAWRPSGVDQSWLRRAIALLQKVDRSLPGEMSWDQARLQAARLRMEA